jgi:hypothetical protein
MIVAEKRGVDQFANLGAMDDGSLRRPVTPKLPSRMILALKARAARARPLLGGTEHITQRTERGLSDCQDTVLSTCEARRRTRAGARVYHNLTK